MKERALISKIKSRFLCQSDYLLKGIGDDSAVFADSKDFCWLISTDLLVDDVHFLRGLHDPYLLGRKSIAVNLSDIAAMGAEPRFALVSLAVPPYLLESWLDSWQDGVESMLREHNCLLIGGDTTKGSVITINVVVLGSARPDQVLYRSGAGIGDDIYVTGPLGSSVTGLELLKREEQVSKYPQFTRAHLDPQPQVKTGILLGRSGLVSAMQDISDGVATDMSHICTESEVGAVIYADKLPYEKELKGLCSSFGWNLCDTVLGGGEDYELLFTAAPSNRKALELLAQQQAQTFVRIGKVTPPPVRVMLEENGLSRDITFSGFEHN